MQPQQLNPEEQFVVVGQIGRPHGIDGSMRINSYTQPAENILDYKPWFIRKKDTQHWEDLQYEKVEYHAKGLVIFLKGINDRNIAAHYTLADIGVSRDKLPCLPDNEYYWSDLEGLSVQTQTGDLLGTVDHLFETGSNDVLVIKGGVDKKEHLIPFLKGNTILNIDLLNKIIVVDWDPDF